MLAPLMGLTFLILMVTSANSSPVPEIIGGVEAIPGEFPWMVSIQAYSGNNTFTHICGGTIVEKNHVVTGAHCLSLYAAAELRVVAGAHNIKNYEASQQIRAATKITRHSEYNLPAFRNDIGILKVSPAFEETNEVRGLQMPPNNVVSSGWCTIAGWGSTLTNGQGLSDVLRKVVLPVVTKESCYLTYPNDFHAESQMCAGRKEGGQDACIGDTGGALVCDDLGYKYFAGIASYGYLCAQPNAPGVYMEVSRFIDWIQCAAYGCQDDVEIKPFGNLA